MSLDYTKMIKFKGNIVHLNLTDRILQLTSYSNLNINTWLGNNAIYVSTHMTISK